MGADNPSWVAPEAGAARARPVALALRDQARARTHHTDLSSRLTDQAFGHLGRDTVLTITGLQDAGKLPDCGAPAREQVIDLAGAGHAGPAGIVQASGGARGRVMAWPAAGSGVLAAGGRRGEEDEQA